MVKLHIEPNELHAFLDAAPKWPEGLRRGVSPTTVTLYMALRVVREAWDEGPLTAEHIAVVDKALAMARGERG